jgi:hypothetical protein
MKLAPDDKDARSLLASTLDLLGRGSDAAALRAAASQAGVQVSQSVPQDTAALVRLARMSRNFDRSLLRSTGEDPAAPPGKASHRSEGKGDPR